ncbi:energy-coupling factor transporter transmembrane protein EcfT [Afifella sp. IM 167]|uniref:energy-coupling factor transporter transmembrane component T family protein n=1 Tax=Afifella sp. IM 167 TaxID=2033586 RepID=UPI001CCE7E9E|nr:energy-coupling factor transporter transmembrane protein EcfT [Afifella sp. IM 167]MBZ8132422.1 cobalt ABC transporter [Afifella sp. IM 167]
MTPEAGTLSPLHRLPAWAKLMALAIAGTGLVLIGDWRLVAAALLATLGLYRLAGISQRKAFQQLRPLMWLLVLLFLVQGLWQSWELASLVVLRIATLVLAAALVTLTTRSEALIAAIEGALGPFRRFGVNPAKVGLAFSLALRFIPVIGQQAQEIRDAQRARGLGTNPVALALPLILRTLKMAGDVADAIDARSPYSDPYGDDDDLPPRFVIEPGTINTRTSCKTAEAPQKT